MYYQRYRQGYSFFRLYNEEAQPQTAAVALKSSYGITNDRATLNRSRGLSA